MASKALYCHCFKYLGVVYISESKSEKERGTACHTDVLRAPPQRAKTNQEPTTRNRTTMVTVPSHVKSLWRVSARFAGTTGELCYVYVAASGQGRADEFQVLDDGFERMPKDRPLRTGAI